MSYYRYTFTFEILSTEEDFWERGRSLDDINYECTMGHMSGRFLNSTTEEVPESKMKSLLKTHGTVEDFFEEIL